MATIEVRAKDVPVLSAQHMYITFTLDSGDKLYVRGGPETQTYSRTGFVTPSACSMWSVQV